MLFTGAGLSRDAAQPPFHSGRSDGSAFSDSRRRRQLFLVRYALERAAVSAGAEMTEIGLDARQLIQ